ncbi:MAG: FAD-binding protein [Oscillospiraceae bacterium]
MLACILTKEMPEMMPAAHTNLGGIRITAALEHLTFNLFACGEVIGGLHGANRIGGSAGAETVVFGAIAGNSAAAYLKTVAEQKESVVENAAKTGTEHVCRFLGRPMGPASAADIRAKLGVVMAEYMGIARDEAGLLEAKRQVKQLGKIAGTGRSGKLERVHGAVSLRKYAAAGKYTDRGIFAA